MTAEIVGEIADRNLLSLHPRVIEVETSQKTDLGRVLYANSITLTPGTVSTFLSADRRCLIIHSLHTTAPEEMIATIRRRYEQPLKEALETC